jgi:hypothetical protein
MTNFKIQVRRDTAANWQSINPVLGMGEPGWDTTNLNLKIGDGTTAWNNLAVASYAEIAAFDVTPSSPMPVNAYGELMETLQAMRMYLEHLSRSNALSLPDTGGRQRVSVENFTAGVTVNSITAFDGWRTAEFTRNHYYLATETIRRNITVN